MKKTISPLFIIPLFLISCNLEFKEQPAADVTGAKEETEEKEIEQVSTTYLYGIDISHHQHKEIDSITKKHDTLSFIICKATEGVTYMDPRFQLNWSTAKEKSFIRGAYHFYRTNDNPIQQATQFLHAVSDIQATDLPPILDFEEGGIDKSQSIEEVQSGVRQFLIELETKLNRTPILYTDINTGNKYLNDPFFANYPLWIANYNGKEEPNLPKAWESSGWVFWQSSDSYTLGSTVNDFDKFTGNLNDLKEFIKDSHKK